MSWICAIREATIEHSVTAGDCVFEYRDGEKIPLNTPYRADLERYLKVQTTLNKAEGKEEYLEGLKVLFPGETDAEVEEFHLPLTIPVQWIREQIEGEKSLSSIDNNSNSYEFCQSYPS